METILGILSRDYAKGEKTLRSLLRSPDIGRNFLSPNFVETTTDIWHQSSLHEDIRTMLKNAEDAADMEGQCLPPLEAQDDIPSHVSTPSADSEGLALSVAGSLYRPPTVSEPFENLPAEAPELIDTYFLHIHCWFPVVERRDVLRILHSDNTHAGLDLRDNGHRTCLWSLVALVLASQKPSEEQSRTVEQYASLAQSQISINQQTFEIGHIQAALLLTLLKIGRGQLESAWIYLGQVSRMLSMYIERCSCRPFRLPHVIRGCQILEGLVSASLNRSACVHFTNDFDVDIDDEALDEWEAWSAPRSCASSQTSNKIRRIPLRALSIFRSVSQLMQRLNTVLSTPSNEFVLDDATAELRHWMAGLPSYCTSIDSEYLTPCVLSLNLIYNFAILTILKRQNTRPISASSMIKDTVRKILDSLRCYIEMSGFAHPVIAVFAKQGADCLKAFNSTLR